MVMTLARKYQPLRPNGAMTHALALAETIVSRLAQAATAEDVSAALELFAGRFGLRMTGHITVLNNAPDHTISFAADPRLDGYFRDYHDLNCIECDGILWQAQHQSLPVPWGLSEQRANLNRREIPLFSLVEDYGMFRGLLVPIHGPHGLSALGTASDEDEAGFRKRLPEFGLIAQLVGIYLHDAVHRVCVSPSPHPLPKLTPRERECLSWVAAGKTAWEISQILSVSEATAIFHTENAKKKLDAKTLPQAVARAISLKLISV